MNYNNNEVTLDKHQLVGLGIMSGDTYPFTYVNEKVSSLLGEVATALNMGEMLPPHEVVRLMQKNELLINMAQSLLAHEIEHKTF